MVTDESFEQVANLETKHPQYAGNGWANLTSATSSGKGEVSLRFGDAFSGNVSATMTMAGTSASSASSTSWTSSTSVLDVSNRVALVNRGLYHQGYALRGGAGYSGYVYLRCNEPVDLVAELVDQQGNTPLARAQLSCPGVGEWTQVQFTLTPSASTACGNFPTDTPPLDCISDPNDGCLRCGGSFVLALEQPGSVDVDAAYLAPDEWARFGNTEALREPVEALLAMGVKSLRFGGTFAWQAGYLWKEFRGLRPAREAYSAFHDPKEGASRGFGFFEVLELCQEAELTCILTMNILETPDDLADFVEYSLGDAASTSWGATRADDGRNAPYGLTHIQLGNEQYVEDLVGTFVKAAAAMEARATLIGLPGVLRYIVGTGRASDGPAIVADANTTVLIDEIVAAGLCSQTLFDWHIVPSAAAAAAPDAYALGGMAELLQARGCGEARLAVLEENQCDNFFTRALDDASAAAAIARHSDVVEIRTTSQCWTAAGHAAGCAEGHVLVAPNSTVLQAPAWAQSMAAEAYREYRAEVRIEADSPDVLTLMNLTASATSGADGSLALRIVNPSSIPVHATILFNESTTTPSPFVKISTLTSPLADEPDFNSRIPNSTGFNTLSNPLFIRPGRSKENDFGNGSTIELAPWSFTTALFEPWTF